MNTSSRLRSIVSRFFGSVSLHPPAVVGHGVYSPNILHHPHIRKMATPYMICRNFTVATEKKSELEQTGEVDDVEIPTFKEFVSQLPSQKEYAATLMQALGCQKKDLQIIQQENLYWRSLPIDVILERIKAFEELGVKKDDLLKISSLLFTNFEKSFKTLSLTCEVLGLNGHMLLPMLLLPEAKLKSYLSAVSSESKILGAHQNRIKFFSDELQIPVRVFTEELLLHNYLLKTPLTRIIDMMDALLEAKVNRIDIFSDLWVFKCNVIKAKQRLEACQQAGLENIKPWVVRIPEDKFWRYVELRTAKQVMFKGLPWVEFVAKLLNSSVEEVEAMIKYDQRVLKVSHLKAQTAIEYLLSEGFTCKEILQSPYVFTPSVKTLQKRLNMMKDAGLKPQHHPEVLRRMSLSNKAFLETFKKYFINYDYTSAQKGS